MLSVTTRLILINFQHQDVAFLPKVKFKDLTIVNNCVKKCDKIFSFALFLS